ITAPVRLLLIDAHTFRPLESLQIHVRARPTDKVHEYSSNADGLVLTREAYAHAVEVEVFQGNTPLARLPVAIVDERPITCRIEPSAAAESVAPLEYRRDQWLRRLFDDLRAAGERVTALNQVLNRS